MIEHDALISEYSHEKSRPREAEALRALQKVASMVKPIMRQRGWRVGVLAEFFPAEHNLLGINWNRGQKICLRLRYPGDERQFMPLENVVDTMLHELCHIVHGPHNDAFHALWNQLREEHESLLRKGYTGEGFLSTGRKLGGGVTRIPMHEARRRARTAAEERRIQSAGSGQKLGGRAHSRGEDIRRVIADAAQRRINISRGCAAVDDDKRRAQIVEEATRNGFKTKAEEDDANEQAIMQAYIELIQEEEREKYGKDYVQPSSENPAGSQGVASPVKEEPGPSRVPPVPTNSKPPPKQTKLEERRRPPPQEEERKIKPEPEPELDPELEPDPVPEVESEDDFWSCTVCTLNNPLPFLSCEACGSERPPLYNKTPPSSTASQSPVPAQIPNASTLNSRQSAPRPNAAKLRAPLAPRSAASTRAVDAAASRTRRNNGLRDLASLYETENSKPLGWLCSRCGNFMESEWWTCAGCGAMKQAS